MWKTGGKRKREIERERERERGRGGGVHRLYCQYKEIKCIAEGSVRYILVPLLSLSDSATE